MKNFLKEDCMECGIDECGRGSFLGPVVTGCVIWPVDYVPDPKYVIKDSKKLSKKKREELYDYIIETALDWNVNFVDNIEIDKLNILQATMKSMHKNLDKLNIDIDHAIIDGTYFNKYKDIDYTTVQKADDKYYSVAAASILAKVSHDRYIEKLCEDEPELNEKYDLLNNMAYGTAKHIEGIKKNGICKYHRKTFGICKNY